MSYCTLSQIRAMEGMEEAYHYTDTAINEGIGFATSVIDEFTGTSWEYKAFDITVSGSNRRRISLEDPFDGRRILFPRTITTLTIDGVSQDTSVLALYPEGYLVSSEYDFGYDSPGNNIRIAGTAGITSVAPDDIAWAARTITRQYVIDLLSRVDDRAVLMTNELGTIRLAQPGTKQPTGLPQVDVVLNRRRQRGPAII